MKGKEYKIAVISGDGIGPEIMSCALKVLSVVSKVSGAKFEYNKFLAGGIAWEKVGEHLPEETIKGCRESDAILFGAVGGPVSEINEPKWKDAERNVILGLRKEFDLFANLRPIKSGDINLIIVRELTGGIYFGDHKTEEVEGIYRNRKIIRSYDVMEYNSFEIERILRVGFETARKRRKKLTLVDKANVLDTSRLWRKVAEDIKDNYKDVELDYMFVDNAAYQIIKNPKLFDVVVTSNMFGDILSDEASVLANSLGTLYSASLGNGSFGMYEPAHGSAPKHAGKNDANPVAMIMSAAMMLKFSFGLDRESKMIESAVFKVLDDGFGTYDMGLKNVVGTKEFGELVSKNIMENKI